MNTHEALQSLEAERRLNQAEVLEYLNTNSGSRRTRGLTREARVVAANMDAYLHAARRHAEAMGRPTDVYEGFMEIVKGCKDEQTSMDVRRRIMVLLEGYPAFIRGFSMLLPFVLEEVVRAKL